MSLSCIYHKSQPFRVVEDEIAEELLATGEWFTHPNCIKEEINHEEQIRQRTRKRRSNGKDSSQ